MSQAGTGSRESVFKLTYDIEVFRELYDYQLKTHDVEDYRHTLDYCRAAYFKVLSSTLKLSEYFRAGDIAKVSTEDRVVRKLYTYNAPLTLKAWEEYYDFLCRKYFTFDDA